MASIIGAIASSVIKAGGEYLNKREETHKIEVQGKVKEKLIEVEGNVKAKIINEQGKVDIRKLELSNERESVKEDHLRKMQDMEYNYKLKDKHETNEHEINVMKQKDARSKQDEEMKIKSEDHHAKNIRDLKELEGKLNVQMTKTKGEIEATLKEINLKESKES